MLDWASVINLTASVKALTAVTITSSSIATRKWISTKEETLRTETRPNPTKNLLKVYRNVSTESRKNWTSQSNIIARNNPQKLNLRIPPLPPL